MIERWKAIDGFPGYEVSDLGCVRSRGRIKATDRDPKGYLRVKLWRNSKPTNARVNRLVVIAFIGPIPDGMVVRHMNGKVDDNRLVNLKIGTYSDNEQDKKRHGTVPIGERHHSSKLTAAQVSAIRARYRKGSRDTNLRTLGAEFGIAPKVAGQIVRRETWKHVP